MCKKLENVPNVISKIDSFRVCVSSEWILLKRRQSVIYRTTCYSINQHSTTLVVFFCCKKKQKFQCSGLTSKHSNSFVIVFFVWRQFFLFLRDKFWCFYHFLWSFWHKKYVLFMEIYIMEMESSILPLTKHAIIM